MDRLLYFTVVSAKDLKDDKVFSKMEVYAVATLAGDPGTRQRTLADKNAGRNPVWNSLMKFSVDEAAADQLSLHIQIRSERSRGDRDIGEVHVPIKELLDTAGDGKSAQFVSRQVIKPSGKPKGVLSFSYKFGEKITASAPAQAANLSNHATAKPGVYPAGPSAAYPASGASVPYPPPVGMHPYHPPGGYPPPPVAAYGYGAPPSGCGAPQLGYGAPPPGYGYQPQQAGYGYGYSGPVEGPPKKNKFWGMGSGAGFLEGILTGSRIGEMISDAYQGGFDNGGFDDGAGFDF